jgi:tRNA-specific adenosine deaminase 2
MTTFLLDISRKGMEDYMEAAFELAREALSVGEVPVGCVFVDSTTSKIIARGRNVVNETKNATRHAEMVCVDEVVSRFPNPREYSAKFGETTVYVTCEPCVMCAQALVDLRVKKIVYGCANPRFGGCGSVLDVPGELNESGVEVVSGVRADEAVGLLKQFYDCENPNAPADKVKKKS